MKHFINVSIYSACTTHQEKYSPFENVTMSPPSLRCEGTIPFHCGRSSMKVTDTGAACDFVTLDVC